MQYSVEVRNAKLDAVERAIGNSAVLRIRSGTLPATCDDPDSGEILAMILLPQDWMLPAQFGEKSKSALWRTATVERNGRARHFRIYEASGARCHLQGTFGILAGEDDERLVPDMIGNTADFHLGQLFTVDFFIIVDNNG